MLRVVLGVVALLVALATMGLLAKKQLSDARPAIERVQPAPTAAQEVQQYKQAIEGLTQPRAMPDADK